LALLVATLAGCGSGGVKVGHDWQGAELASFPDARLCCIRILQINSHAAVAGIGGEALAAIASTGGTG
jgi:hypothetical protein